MKKCVCILLSLLCILLAGCVAEPDGAADNNPVQSTTTTSTTTTTTTATTTTTTAAPAFISEDKALEIASDHWGGIQAGERDPKTGFIMSMAVMESPTAASPQYRIVLQWLVETDGAPSHLSKLDEIRIDAVTGTVLTEAE